MLTLCNYLLEVNSKFHVTTAIVDAKLYALFFLISLEETTLQL